MDSSKRKLGKERLQRIINLCREVEEKGLNPFVVDVNDLLAVIREYFPEWRLPEELCLDAEALHHIAAVIKLQSDWVKHHSTSLYTDPFLLEEKIRALSQEGLVEVFLRAWHPIVELEQITAQSLIRAAEYWRDLLPLSERWARTASQRRGVETISLEELVRQRILAEKAFSEELLTLWAELKERTGGEGRIRYWDFIGAETYAETVRRAYLTSFLITHGYATLEIHRLEGEIFIRPGEGPSARAEADRGEAVSIPISVGFEDWKQRKEGGET